MIVERKLAQTVTYWGTPAPDGFGGLTFAAPVQMSGRWEERTELFVDASGREARSQAVVYAAQDVGVGGYLALGAFADPSPTAVSGAREIRAVHKSPNLRATRFVRKAWL